MTDSKKIYFRMAPDYDEVSKRKSTYLESVNNLIFKHASKTILNYLDAGGGDGNRTFVISKKIGAKYSVLIDNSSEMIKIAGSKGLDEVHCTDILSYSSRKSYDLITSLWNVFGHIETRKERTDSLVNLNSMLSNDGVFMIDVNNRYNIEYGYFNVIKNIIFDILPSKSSTHGWFSFKFKDKTFPVYLHSPFEILSELKNAGFEVIEKYGVNYSNGKISKNFYFKGQMFLVARKRDRV
jgi:2-polyprenyl-3-methyl-5-hydroxy-6-metoxy-1,4-benzoquinol methylase